MLSHEQHHKTDYYSVVVTPINFFYKRYYSKYQFSYCVNAFSNHRSIATKDLKTAFQSRENEFISTHDESLFRQYSSAFDSMDYPKINHAIEQYSFRVIGQQPANIPIYYAQ